MPWSYTPAQCNLKTISPTGKQKWDYVQSNIKRLLTLGYISEQTDSRFGFIQNWKCKNRSAEHT